MYLQAVMGPGTELHEAGLRVKGKVADVDFAVGFENGGRVPFDVAVVVQYGLGHGGHYVLAVSTKSIETQTSDLIKMKTMVKKDMKAIVNANWFMGSLIY